jgi:hypothetical protein
MTRQAYLTGDKEVDETLRVIPIQLARDGLRFATRAAAKVVLVEARKRVPAGKSSRSFMYGGKPSTGRLKRSLTVRVATEAARGRKLPKGTIGHAVVTRDGNLFKGETYYGGFLELGWTKGGRKHQYSYLRPALYASKAAVRREFIAHTMTGLERAVRKARTKKSYAVPQGLFAGGG